MPGNGLYSFFFFHPVILSAPCAMQCVLGWLHSNTKTQSFSSSRSSEVLGGHKWVHRSLQFCDTRILIRPRSQHTLCVEWLNGENLKPSVLARMCRDRQTMGRGSLYPFVALMSCQSYSSLPKGYFSLSPIPVGLVKMCAVCPGQKSGLRGPSLGEDRQSPWQCQAAEWEKSLPEPGRFLRI